MVSTKGGQGKSTLSLCMSYSKAFEKKYKSVGLVEMDIQGTLRSWYVERSEEEKNKNDNVSFTHLIVADCIHWWSAVLGIHNHQSH